MIKLKSETTTSGIVFPFLHKIEISSSYETLTDTGSFIVPKKIKFRDAQGNNVENITKGENAVFKRGDDCLVRLGYEENLEERFRGFLSGIRTKFPLEFSIEDDMFFLKQNSYTLTMKNPKLSELIPKVIPSSVTYKIWAEFNLGDFRITKASSAVILNELRKKHGVYSWFRNGVLNIGLAVVPELQKTVRFTMFKDIIKGDDLQFINDFDRKIKLVAKSIKDDNTQLEAKAGDEDGETRTLYFYNIENEKDLQKIADQKVEQLKFTGYEGSFVTFLTPSVNHGDIVEIVNPQIEEQSGGYICEKVVINFGMSGGRQKISIKQKVYDLIKNNSGEWIKAN